MNGGLRQEVRWYLGSNSKANAEHFKSLSCVGMGCGYVVEEHQKWGKPEVGAVPEFTIEVAYKTKNREGKPVSPGWRYALKWLENGEQHTERQYGFEEKDAAVRAAQRRAKAVALTLAPVHVETYTPEI